MAAATKGEASLRLNVDRLPSLPSTEVSFFHIRKVVIRGEHTCKLYTGTLVTSVFAFVSFTQYNYLIKIKMKIYTACNVK